MQSTQLKLQCNIAKIWGYQNDNQPERRQRVQTVAKIASITPLRLKSNIQASPKMLQVQLQLHNIQTQKKLREMLSKQSLQPSTPHDQLNPSQTPNNSPIIKMMCDRIAQYNYLVDHKHITSKQKSFRGEPINITKYDKGDELVNQIKNMQEKLVSADLTRRIELNEAIAQKYKEYRSVIFNERQKMLSDGKVNSTEEKRITIFEGSQGQEESSEHKMQFNIYPQQITRSRVISIDPTSSKFFKEKQVSLSITEKCLLRSNMANKGNQSVKNNSMQNGKYYSRLLGGKLTKQNKLANGSNNSNRYYVNSLILLNPTGQYSNHKLTKSMVYKRDKSNTTHRPAESQQDINKTLKQPYLSASLAEKGKYIDKKTLQDQEVVEYWTGRINEYKSMAHKCRKKRSKPKRSKGNKSPVAEPISNRIFITPIEHVSLLQHELKRSSFKEKVLETLLLKRKARYVKIAGTKLISKYDPKAEAKILLGAKHSNEDHDAAAKIANNIILQRKQPYQQYFTQDQSVRQRSPAERQIHNWIISQKNDQKSYWAMCKNEKVNLLLGRK